MRNKTFHRLLAFVALLLLATSACKKNSTTPQQPAQGENVVKDIDGNVYHTVDIGVQTWMVENLKVTRYLNGDPIPYSATDITNGAYCNYNNDATLASVYGRLYNYSAINDSRGICPDGWRLPTDADWTQLDYTLGGANASGGELKEAGTVHWNAPNTGATNSSGFTALPGGNASAGQFNELGKFAFFWGSPNSTESRALYNTGAGSAILFMTNETTSFLSIRCVKE